MAETTHTEWRRGQLREQRDPFHCLLFNSSALYYLQTPPWRYGHASTPPQFLPISGDRDVSLLLSLEWPVWSPSSGNKCYAVHRSLSSGVSLWSGTFTLSHIISRAHLRDFFRLLAIGMCHFRYLWNGICDRHRAEITVMQFTGHSLPVHHSEVGPSPCPILSAEHTCAISFDYWPLGCVTSAIFGMAGVIVIEWK